MYKREFANDERHADLRDRSRRLRRTARLSNDRTTLQARGWWGAIGYGAALVGQVAMIVLGVIVNFGVENGVAQLDWLGAWALIGTLYASLALLGLGLSARLPADARPHRFIASRLSRIVATSTTILASMTGLTAALRVLALSPDWLVGLRTTIIGVWVMVLAWGFLHWGFAQIYLQRSLTADEPQFDFPRTPLPRMVDFVYFSFTVGSSFAASDVTVLSSRTRWTVVWHSVSSFFFNGLIIVLALNTIMSNGFR